MLMPQDNMLIWNKNPKNNFYHRSRKQDNNSFKEVCVQAMALEMKQFMPVSNGDMSVIRHRNEDKNI